MTKEMILAIGFNIASAGLLWTAFRDAALSRGRGAKKARSEATGTVGAAYTLTIVTAFALWLLFGKSHLEAEAPSRPSTLNTQLSTRQ